MLTRILVLAALAALSGPAGHYALVLNAQRGQAPPRYELTDRDRQALRAKLDELDPLVAALKAKRGEDDLLADVEIHAKGGRWILEFPQDVTVQEDVTFALKMLEEELRNHE
jgi:hypothetical protein